MHVQSSGVAFAFGSLQLMCQNLSNNYLRCSRSTRDQSCVRHWDCRGDEIWAVIHRGGSEGRTNLRSEWWQRLTEATKRNERGGGSVTVREERGATYVNSAWEFVKCFTLILSVKHFTIFYLTFYSQLNSVWQTFYNQTNTVTCWKCFTKNLL